MENELVSVVIPCFNQGKYLEETINSVLASTYRPVEIIIVNDGSTDESLETANNLKEKYPEIRVIDQANAGVAKSRNRGINSASGTIILPLDGDDLISPNYMEEAVKILNNNPEVKVVYSHAFKFDASGRKPWKLKPFSRNQLARDNMIFVASFFRKIDFEAIGGFSEDMTMGREDWEFWIKMLKNEGEVVQLPFAGFYYRLTPTSKRKKTGTNRKKRERIAYLNARHKEFFERELNGPLRLQRSLSRPYNTFLKKIGRL